MIDFFAALPALLDTLHLLTEPLLGYMDDYGDDEGGGRYLLLLAGPAAAGGVYWGLYRYYRNTDKSHQYERDTVIESQPVTGSDTRVGSVSGVSNSRISGDNSRKHRTRVRRLQ